MERIKSLVKRMTGVSFPDEVAAYDYERGSQESGDPRNQIGIISSIQPIKPERFDRIFGVPTDLIEIKIYQLWHKADGTVKNQEVRECVPRKEIDDETLDALKVGKVVGVFVYQTVVCNIGFLSDEGITQYKDQIDLLTQSYQKYVEGPK